MTYVPNRPERMTVEFAEQAAGAHQPSHMAIPPFISDKERLEILEYCENNMAGFNHHMSTKKPGEPDPLQFQYYNFRDNTEYTTILSYFSPGANFEWHTSGTGLGRTCVIIHPLTYGSTPCETIEGPVYTPIILNPRRVHQAVNITPYPRFGLQICLDWTIREVLEQWESYWVPRLYKDMEYYPIPQLHGIEKQFDMIGFKYKRNE